MNGDHCKPISESQMQILEELANASLTPKVIAIRSRIILFLEQGMAPSLIRVKLGVSFPSIYKWKNRWFQTKTDLDQIEQEKTRHELKLAIKNALKDAPRKGAPPKFSDVQVLQIVSLACTSPNAEGLPVSHWSCRLLAEHATRLGIVESISYKQISNFLKSGVVKTS